MDSHETLQPRSTGGDVEIDWSSEMREPPVSVEQEFVVVSPEISKPESFNTLVWFRLLWQHPLVFWSGIWVILLLITGVAVSVLMNPYLSKPEQPDAPIAGQPIPEINDDRGTMPMWALGTIALSCVVGSLLISQRLKHTQQERRSLQSKSAASPHALHSHHELDAAKLTLSVADLATLEVPPEPLSSMEPSPQPPTLDPIQPAPVAPVVTVLPVDESNPLDWEDAGLAELMDIRYRRHR